jgi:hypothetical protein
VIRLRFGSRGRESRVTDPGRRTALLGTMSVPVVMGGGIKMMTDSGGFSQEITGGLGSLRIPQIQSPNFSTGASGWRIARDGSVEFNNGIFRGTLEASVFEGTNFIINSNGAFFYDSVAGPGAGNLRLSNCSSQTVDPFGNAALTGMTTYGATTAQSVDGTEIRWWSAASQSGPWVLQSSMQMTGIGSTNALNFSAGSINTGGAGINMGAALLTQKVPASTIPPNIMGKIVYCLDGSGNAETWHGLTFQNGWLNVIGRTPCSYKLVAAPDQCMIVTGSAKAPAGVVVGQIIGNTGGSAPYLPTSIKSFGGRNITTNAAVEININTLGQIQFDGPVNATAGDTIEWTSPPLPMDI